MENWCGRLASQQPEQKPGKWPWAGVGAEYKWVPWALGAAPGSSCVHPAARSTCSSSPEASHGVAWCIPWGCLVPPREIKFGKYTKTSRSKAQAEFLQKNNLFFAWPSNNLKDSCLTFIPMCYEAPSPFPCPSRPLGQDHGQGPCVLSINIPTHVPSPYPLPTLIIWTEMSLSLGFVRLLQIWFQLSSGFWILIKCILAFVLL